MNTLDLEVFGEDERRIRKSNVRHIFIRGEKRSVSICGQPEKA